jgi:signal transduction histidine kinase
MSEPIISPVKLLEAITKAQSQYIFETDPNLLFNELLDTLLSITNSEYGFIGEILYEEDKSPYLKTHAITNIAWNDETRKFYAENQAKGLEFKNLKSLFGEVISKKQYIISNDPYNDPRRTGLPKGHPHMGCFLGIPFFRAMNPDDEMIGMVGIANRPGGYFEQITYELKPFLSTCSNIIEGYRIDNLRKIAERKLIIEKEKALESNQLKTNFLNTISHELKTPLTIILGNLSLLKDENNLPEKDEYKEIMNDILGSGNQLAEIIDDILDITKIEANKHFLTLEKFSLTDLINNVIKQNIAQIESKNLKTSFNFDEKIEIIADKEKIARIYQNLLKNSIKFSKEGLIKTKVGKSNGYIFFSIEDQGIGIDPINHQIIFDVFSQIDGSSKRIGGIGMGLTICKRFVELHNGTIQIESELGKGSRFTVSIPIEIL